MELTDIRYSVLIVSCYPRFTEALLDIIREEGITETDVALSVTEAKRRLSDRDYDLVLIRAPLRDEDGLGFSAGLVRKRSCAAAVFVSMDRYADASARDALNGVFTIPLTASKQVVCYSLNWLKAARERLRQGEQKSLSLEARMGQIRRINHAKWMLITQEAMTEEQAHHWLERQAMDRGLTKAVVAEEIIDRYEKDRVRQA